MGISHFIQYIGTHLVLKQHWQWYSAILIIAQYYWPTRGKFITVKLQYTSLIHSLCIYSPSEFYFLLAKSKYSPTLQQMLFLKPSNYVPFISQTKFYTQH